MTVQEAFEAIDALLDGKTLDERMDPKVQAQLREYCKVLAANVKISPEEIEAASAR